MRRMALTLAAAALALGAALPAHAADTWTVDKDHSVVSFEVRHLLSNVRGKFDVYQATVVMDPAHPEAGSVSLTIDAKSIDTGVDKRDAHLRSSDFFDVANNPQITFRSRKIVPLPGKNRYAVAGTLTMRGVAKEVTLPVEILGTMKDPMGNLRAGFSTSVTLDRKDYGISWNKALDEGGYLLGDDVQVEIQLETVKQAAQPAK